MKARRYEEDCRQRGVALVEFLLVIPTLLLVFFGAVELARFIRVRQGALVLNREAALRASRECGGILSIQAGAWSIPETELALQSCLQRVTGQLQGVAETSIPGTTFRFSTLKRLPTPTVATHSYQFGGGEPLSLPSDGQSVLWGATPIMSRDDFLIMRQLVLVEVRYRYQPLCVEALSVIGFSPLFSNQGVYSDVSIF